ncbi:hypothetical protein SNE40_009709 [Patella caerulea]|uniref:Uncharacterized protein n=1 Tax=Patella caerulea TaxID=87958 RepID=A0AAN8PQM6_PATCE
MLVRASKEKKDFLNRDHPQYSWSIPSLDRRLRHFDIYYTNTDVSIDVLKEAVEEELNGPGALLGYRAMHKKIRKEHGLNVPRDLVYAAMTELDSNDLQERRLLNKTKKEKRCYYSKGPNWVHSLDGFSKSYIPVSCI